MDWLELIISAFGGSILTGIGGIFYFRSKLKEARADASIKETEAKDAKNDYLEKRIASMERLWDEQGKELDALRKELLELRKEKFENAQKIVHLESENKALREKVDRLEREVGEYRRAYMAREGSDG